MGCEVYYRGESQENNAIKLKSIIEEITLGDFKSVKYHEISDNEKWKSVMIKELIDIKFGKLQAGNISAEEIMNFLCTS